MNKKIIGIIIGIACVVIGIVILISFFKAQKTQTGETTATIIRLDSEVETEVDSDGFERSTQMYYPVIEYTVDNQKYETRLPDSGTSNSTEYKEGQTVEIKYNPNNPNEISKKGSKGGLIAGIFFIVVGIIVGIASFVEKIG